MAIDVASTIRSMRVRLPLRILLVLAWIPLLGGVSAAQSPPNPAEDHVPTPYPDRIILNLTADSSTSMAVTWRTSVDVVAGRAEIAVAGPNKEFEKEARSFESESAVIEHEAGKARCHSVVFRDLAPKTKYAYRVGDGGRWSEWFHFSTASRTADPFSFIYFGDAQNDVKPHWSRVVREAFADSPRAAFLLHAGDLINKREDWEWGDWHRAGGWVNASIPNIMTPGNHEYGVDARLGTPAYRLTPQWRAQFTLPTNGPAGLEETVYFCDYQGVRFVSLNSNESFQEQSSWLEAVLRDNPNRWTVATFHHPIYSAAKGRDNPLIRSLWQPLFDRYQVDLVLQGHDHAYARTGLERMKNVPTGAAARSGGTVYVVSVSGPKMYNLDRDDRMRRAAANTQLYQIVSIDGMELRYEARTAVGELYDAFLLRKRDGEPNELIDQIPDLPERLENSK